jgi:hypothetical protein
MTIHEKNKKRKKFRIEELLSEVRGSKTELIRELNMSPNTFSNFLKGDVKIGKQKEITKVFNEAFETNYSNKELFSLVD